MGWQQLTITKEEERDLRRHFSKKSKFLVDESLGLGVTEFLRELKCNVKDVSEVGLSGHSDEDVLAYAHREDRILLTHDDDFLDDRRFPPQCNPGIVILPGSDGNVRVLTRALMEMLSVVGEFRQLWRRCKIVLEGNGQMRIVGRDRDSGAMKTTRYRVRNRQEEIWVQE